MKVALAGLLLALATTPAQAECAAYDLVPRIATPPSSTLPVDGGFVIYAAAHPGGVTTSGDPAVQPRWRFRGGAKPTIVSLAPGLAVMKPPAISGSARANVELLDDSQRFLIAGLTTTTKRKLLDAPKLRSAIHEERGGRRHYEQVNLELAAPAPAGVLAIVLLDDKGAKSWQLVTSSATTVAGYSQGGCTPLPNGTRPSKAGDTIRVAFVDDGGRMSEPSAPIKIRKKP